LGREPQLSTHPTYCSLTLYGRGEGGDEGGGGEEEEMKKKKKKEEVEEDHIGYPLPLVFFLFDMVHTVVY
jgi:hypothetical protein